VWYSSGIQSPDGGPDIPNGFDAAPALMERDVKVRQMPEVLDDGRSRRLSRRPPVQAHGRRAALDQQS
jgi:hypothetical protein